MPDHSRVQEIQENRRTGLAAQAGSAHGRTARRDSVVVCRMGDAALLAMNEIYDSSLRPNWPELFEQSPRRPENRPRHSQRPR